MSVTTSSGDAMITHKLNSERYSTSVCPGHILLWSSLQPCWSAIKLYTRNQNPNHTWPPVIMKSRSFHPLVGPVVQGAVMPAFYVTNLPAYFDRPTLCSMIRSVESQLSWWSGPDLQELAYCHIHSHGLSTPHSQELKKNSLVVLSKAAD